MLWFSIIYKLHVDGIHITSKRNNTVEAMYLEFMMLHDDIIFPDRLKTEPSDNSISHMRGITREFKVNKLISIMVKTGRLWTAMFYSNISWVCIQNSSGGCTATIYTSDHISSHNVQLPSDNVKIECDGYRHEYLKATEDECSVARRLWVDFLPILNTENGMIKILEKSMEVE